MSELHANPVGIITKDIYIIKNDINDKVYIGQSNNVKERFRNHCKKNSKSLLSEDIKKYGKEHFWYEILESDIENYNERETYWINKYNSVNPNGYNIVDGQLPPRYFGDEHSNSKISDRCCRMLKDDLRSTSIPLSKLAKKYGISKRQVLRINQGISRTSLDEDYPIRKKANPNGKLTDEDVTSIIELLKYTYFFNGEIARMFGVEVHAITRINSGELHKRDNVEYPIRKWKSSGVRNLTYEQVTEIINLLKTTDLSLRKISKIYNVDWGVIQSIKEGTKKYRRDGISYPIRQR